MWWLISLLFSFFTLVMAGPLLIIASLNQLFLLDIQFSFLNWLAVLVLWGSITLRSS